MDRRVVVLVVLVSLALGVIGAGSVGSALGGRAGAGIAPDPFPMTIGTDRLSEAKASAKLPARGGIDAFESLAVVDIINDPNCATGQGQPMMVTLGGPTAVQRGDRQGGRRDSIDTEIIALELTGSNPLLGPVIVRESPTQRSNGVVQQIGRDPKDKDATDFPANSFFQVFVEIEFPTEGVTLANEQPVLMENQGIRSIPPIGSEYQSFGEPVPLVDAQTGGPTQFCIVHAAHVPEDPSHIILFGQLVEIERKLDALCQVHALPPGCF